jgi:hypothetical protein
VGVAQGESDRLADWSSAVRESSLKRLARVPAQFIAWRPTPAAMSFADLAQHLIDADAWLFEKLRNPELAPMVGRAGIAGSPSAAEYSDLQDRLRLTGIQRADLIRALTTEQFEAPIPDARFGGIVSVWWVVVRGNLDHEVHHRGQLAAYLRFINGVGL